MNKHLLEIIMPASLVVVLLAIAGCLFTLGNTLTTPDAEVTQTSTPDSVVVTEYGVLRITATGSERLPDSVAAQYLPPLDSALAHLTPEAVAAGEALFKGNCAQCHAMTDVVVGPALEGLTKRRSLPWLKAWVKNSSKVVASGDEYAVKIFNQYQKQQMPSFALTDEEIEQIVAYTQAYSSAKSMPAYVVH